MRFISIKDVVQWRLCVGCGVCSYACPEGNVMLVDIESDGIRPRIKIDNCKACGECVKVCPGIGMTHDYSSEKTRTLNDPRVGWGPVLELWEGFAGDSELRHSGSSGGTASALALYCLEKLHMGSVLHTGMDRNTPWKNTTIISRNRADLLTATGSRYAPASPCDGLGHIEASKVACVFVGKPCDVQGLLKAEAIRPGLAKKVGATLSLFCAGTPSTNATLNLLKKIGIDPGKATSVRYRGRGWPGKFTVSLNDVGTPARQIPYMDAWSFLQQFRPFRCYLCPDSTGEFADISCGDPWYREVKEDELGYSLMVVRTPRGQKIINGAIQAGYLTASRVGLETLHCSQEGMLSKRGAVWGRLLAMRMFGIPTPHYDGFFLFENWRAMQVGEKVRSVLGTVRRIIQRKYYKPSEAPMSSANPKS